MNVITFTIYFQVPPIITYEDRLKEPITQKTESTLLVHVNIIGYPKPSVSWSLNGNTLATANNCNIETSETFSTLTLNNVSGLHSGELTVKAENCVDAATANFTIHIKG